MCGAGWRGAALCGACCAGSVVRILRSKVRWQLLAEPACVDEQVAHALRCQGAYVPFKQSSGLGVWSVSGRMRLPRPAASSMACAGGWGGWLIGMEARVASMMGWQVAVWRRFAGGLLGFAGYGVSQAVFGAVGNCRRLGFVCACAGCVGYVGCRQAVSCLLPLV